MNRTLFEKVKCMVLSSDLPKPFWGETLKTTTYMINMIHFSAFDFQILESLWSWKFPNYFKLKIFGCTAYYHQNKDKLELISLKCVFLGYGEKSKGYRLRVKMKWVQSHHKHKCNLYWRFFLVMILPIRNNLNTAPLKETILENDENNSTKPND